MIFFIFFINKNTFHRQGKKGIFVYFFRYLLPLRSSQSPPCRRHFNSFAEWGVLRTYLSNFILRFSKSIVKAPGRPSGRPSSFSSSSSGNRPAGGLNTFGRVPSFSKIDLLNYTFLLRSEADSFLVWGGATFSRLSWRFRALCLRASIDTYEEGRGVVRCQFGRLCFAPLRAPLGA